MNKLKSFIKMSFLGGITVVMPIALFLFVFKWLFGIVTDMIQPLAGIVSANFNTPDFISDAFVILLILSACFMVGIIVKTNFGRLVQESFENMILNKAPGYALIKTTVMQFLGKGKLPFASVALVRAFENDTLMTGFITDDHPDGSYTVFVPTGPNPTTGFIFHLKKEFVYPVKVSAEEAFRSIISCGRGSTKILETYIKSKAV